MPKLTVTKGGGFNCDGAECCGSSEFVSLEEVMQSFHCEDCSSYIRDKKIKLVKIGFENLGEWIK